MKILLAFNSVFASTMYLFQWYETGECDAPPDIVYDFALSNFQLSGGEEHPGEVWPFFQEFWAPFYPEGSCGHKSPYGGLKDMCCTSSVDLELTIGIRSVTAKYFPDDVIDTTQFPATMNNHMYCKLQKSSNDSLFGYQSLYLSHNEMCLESMKCTASGKLNVFDYANCTGDSRVYDLSANLAAFSDDSTIGSFTGIFTSVNDGTRVVGWTEYVPFGGEPFDFDSAQGVVTILFSVLALIAQMLFLGYITLKYYRKKSRRGLVLIVTVLLWLIFFIIVNVQNMVVFDNDNFYKYQDFRLFWQNLVYLANGWYTGYFLATLLDLKGKKAYLIYAGVFAVHFTLVGSYWIYSTLFLDPTRYTEWDLALLQWSTYVVYYLPVALIWDLTPFVFFFWWVGKVKGQKVSKFWKNVTEMDKFIPLLFATQVLNVIIIFILSGLLSESSNILRNDKNTTAMYNIQKMLVVVHAITNFLIIERFIISISKSNTAAVTKLSTGITAENSDLKKTSELKK